MRRLLTVRCRLCSHLKQGIFDYPLMGRRFKCTQCGGGGAIIKNEPPHNKKSKKTAAFKPGSKPTQPSSQAKTITPAPGHCTHCWEEIAPEKPAVRNGLLYHSRCLGEAFPTPKRKAPDTWNSYKGKTSWRDHT